MGNDMDILVGADPELFLTANGQFQSAFGIIPGTKKQPFKVDQGAVQVDGMALEFNIDPASTEDQFVNSIDIVLAKLREMVPEEYTFQFSPTATFDRSIMEAQPPEAVALGCDPDFNAYSLKQNRPPKAHPQMRAAGGHVHVGWTQGADIRDKFHFDCCAKLARQLDYFLGLPSLMFDDDVERRNMYGQPGAFRPKHYGMEYRTLSNFWVNNPKYRQFVYRGTKKAFSVLVDDGLDFYDNYHNFASECISSNDKAAFLRLSELQPVLREAVKHI